MRVATAGEVTNGEGSVVDARVLTRSYVGGRWQVGLDLGGGPLRLETETPPAGDAVRLWLPRHGGIVFQEKWSCRSLTHRHCRVRIIRPGVRGPLTGLRVVDLSRLVAGNLLTQHLVDFGADVIKVEPREGDTLRHWRVKGVETTWKIHSRGKRSLCMEFRHPGAVDLIRRLIPGPRSSSSFRTGTLEAMGIGRRSY